jgi:glycine cleavage system H protein
LTRNVLPHKTSSTAFEESVGVERHFPENLLYTKEHESCRIDGEVATIVITWHAQDQLGDIVYCELPAIGEQITQGESFGAVESVKAVSDLYAPLSGKVLERNDDVIESPEGLNEDPYDDGWMIKVKLSRKGELEGLIPLDAYLEYLEEIEE